MTLSIIKGVDPGRKKYNNHPNKETSKKKQKTKKKKINHRVISLPMMIIQEGCAQ